MELEYAVHGNKQALPDYVCDIYLTHSLEFNHEIDTLLMLDVNNISLEQVSNLSRPIIVGVNKNENPDALNKLVEKLGSQAAIISIITTDTTAELHQKIKTAIKEEQKYLHSLIYNDYIHLVNILTKGSDISEIESLASKIIGNPMIITDASFKVLCSSKGLEINDPIWNIIVNNNYCPSEIVDILKRNQFWQRLHQSNYPLFVDSEDFAKYVRRAVIEIKSEDEVKGYIALLEYRKRITNTDLQILRMIAELIGAKLTEENAISRAKQQLSKEFISDLLNEAVINEKMAEDRAQSINWNVKKLFTVLNICNQDSERYISDHADLLIQLICQYMPDSKWSISPKHFYAILNYEHENKCINFINGELSNYCKDNYLIIGAGGTVESLMEVSQSFKEAKKAIELFNLLPSLKTSNQLVFNYRELALYDFLNNIISTNKKDLQKYYNKNVLKLKELDQRNNTEYISTLTAYFNNNQNHVDAANSLYLHRNTVLYRIDKIRQIIEDDFDHHLVRLHMNITLKLMELVKD